MPGAFYFAMMLGMLWGSDATEVLSGQKPWFKMTDDEKLATAMLFMVLFVAQLMFLVPVTLILSMAWATAPIGVPVHWPQLLLDYAPALTGVAFALLFFAWTPVRRPGPWIWIAAALFELIVGSRQEILGRTPLDIAVNTPALACILYSLTMFVLNRKIKNQRAV